MKVAYCCRSLSRVESICSKTLKVFSEYLEKIGEKMVIFVEPNEYGAYAVTTKKFPATARRIKTTGAGFWSVDNEILDYLLDEKYDAVFWLDDDLAKVADAEGRINSDCLLHHMPILINTLEKFPEVGAIGFERMRYWLFNKKRPIAFTHSGKQVFGVSIWRTSAMSYMPDGLTNFDDVLMGLNAMSNSFTTLYYNGLGKQVSDNVNKGGNRIHQNLPNVLSSIALIQQKHPMVTTIERAGGRIDIDDEHYKKRWIAVLKKDSVYNQ